MNLPDNLFSENEIYLSCRDEDIESFRIHGTAIVGFCQDLLKYGMINTSYLSIELINAFSIKDNLTLPWVENTDMPDLLYDTNNINIGVCSNSDREVYMSFAYEDNGLDIDDIKMIALTNGYKILLDSDIQKRIEPYGYIFDSYDHTIRDTNNEIYDPRDTEPENITNPEFDALIAKFQIT